MPDQYQLIGELRDIGYVDQYGDLIQSGELKIIEKLDGSGFYLVSTGGGPLAAQLNGALKASYDQLRNAGLRVVESGGVIKFFDTHQRLLAEISNNALKFKYIGYGGDILMLEDRATTVLGKFYVGITDDGISYFLGDAKRGILGFPPGIVSRGVGKTLKINSMNFLDLPAIDFDGIIVRNIKYEVDNFFGSLQDLSMIRPENTIDEIKNILRSKYPQATASDIDDIVARGIKKGSDEFWDTYNLPFLEDAFKRGDNVRLISDPASATFTFERELKAIEGPSGFASKYGYSFNSTLKSFVKN
jgi:hypothetical protein